MRFLPLAAVFLVAVVKGAFSWPAAPCTDPADIGKYNAFLRNHILPDNFGGLNEQEKMKVLRRKYSNCRPPTQSFIAGKANVVNICHGGRRVQGGGNLCVSRQPMVVYDVTATPGNGGCDLAVTETAKPVVVTCDLVQGPTSAVCAPVHFQRYTDQVATAENCQS